MSKDKCPDDIAFTMSKVEFSKKFVEKFIDYDWTTRPWYSKIFRKPLTFKQASVALWKAKHGVR